MLVEARKTHDSDLMKSAAALNKRIKDQAAAFQQFQEAQETLKSSPEDAAANLAVGKHLCFTKGQWQRGLPYLAKGDDKGLQRVAGMETPTPPTGGDDQVKLADAWWDLGQARHSPQREQLLLHAGWWYEKAEASVTASLLKSKIEKRLSEIACAAPVRCVTVTGDGTVYAGVRDHVEVFDRSGPSSSCTPARGMKRRKRR